MNQNQEKIVARLVGSMGQGAPAWVMPWINNKADYPNAVHEIEHAERVLTAYYTRERITFIEKEQDKSFYSPDADMILLPLKKQFRNTGAYYATKAHETIHSTGDYTRCNRPTFSEFTTFRFGDTRYSQEELVAEIGACFLLSALGIDTAQAEHNAAAYINNWLSKLNNNPKWIYKAAALASDAVDYIIETANER